MKQYIHHIPAIVVSLFILGIGIGKYIALYQNSGYVSYDGAYYAEIAHNVEQGKGVVTGNSSFDQNFNVLSRIAPVYPLWPLLGGSVSKLLPKSIPFSKRLKGISIAFYLMALMLFYLLLQRVFENNYLAGATTIFFAFSPVIYKYSSLTYTEPLAILLLFGALLLYIKIDSGEIKYPKIGAIFLGVILTAAFMTRSQSIMLIAALGFFSLFSFYRTRKWSVFLMLWGSFLLTLMPYLYWIYINRGEHFDLSALLIFQNNYDLSPYTPLSHISNEPLGGRFLEGISAFFGYGEYSGIVNSGLLIYLIPVGFLLIKYGTKWERLLLLTGSFYWISLLPTKMEIARVWLFGHRHGILVILLSIAATSIVIRYLYNRFPTSILRKF